MTLTNSHLTGITTFIKENIKKILLISFGILVAIQLIFSATIIVRSEATLKGKVYLFQTIPVDPNDPFRGKYITLNFRDNTFTAGREKWEKGDIVYLTFKKGIHGVATIHRATKEKPQQSIYLRTTVAEVQYGSKVTVNYPFKKFFMEESKAQAAENLAEGNWDKTFAKVRIKNGSAILEDVLIGRVPIAEKVKNSRK